MAKRKAKANRGYSKIRRKSNPGVRRNKSYGGAKHRRVHHRRAKVVHHRRRRNPGDTAIGPMLTNAVFVIVGAMGSKLATQAVLGTNNVGVVGYAGNAAAGAVLWFLAEKVMKNRNAANGIIAGTLVQILLRVINDYTPFGSYVANFGMGDYQMQSFVTPQILVDPMRNATIRVPGGWGPGSAPPMSASAGPKQLAGGRATAAPAGVSGFGMNPYGGNMRGAYG